MNLKDLLYELKSTLNEFADSSADLKQKIREYTPIIFEHIYKIQQYGKIYPDTKRHWASEILGAMFKFCFKKNKATNKSITTNFITKAMTSKYIDSDEILDIVYDCCTKYDGYNMKDIDVESAYSNIILVIPKLINYVKSKAKESDLNELIKIVES